MTLESFKAFLVLGMGNADTLSYSRALVGVRCLAAFAMTFTVSISSYPTLAGRLAKHAKRWGIFLFTLYFWVAASNQLPTPAGVRLTPMFVVIYIATVLVAMGIAFSIRESPHRRDRVQALRKSNEEGGDHGIQKPGN